MPPPRPVALGLDFGTESVRALFVDTGTGRECGTAVVPYKHGVIEKRLPGAGPLPPDWALQHPKDYLDALAVAIKKARKAGKVKAGDVVGIGVDFTASTVLPVDAGGMPLCFKKEFAKRPNAYVKLWKHHAAQAQADRVNALAEQRGESFRKRYGAGVSCEWMIPKALETLEHDAPVYAAAAKWIEAGDWVVWQLGGQEVRSSCGAGYKACWAEAEGHPSEDFLAALNPKLRDLRAKMQGPVRAPGARAGALTPEWAKRLELNEGTPVATMIIDAHAAVPGGSLSNAGDLAIILGTSFCHMLLANKNAPDDVRGVAGSVLDGILPGLMAYEAGQAGGGDLWAWCVRTCANEALVKEARAKRKTPHALLAAKAARYKPGTCGVLALDWLNGNRSPLNRPELSGLFVGVTLATPPEALYRALQEGLAFGTRVILETFESQGLPVKRVVTSGGIAEKDPAFLQILADVTGKTIEVARSSQACAVGAAILGAVAAGNGGGGHDSFASAAAAMGGVRPRRFAPDGKAVEAYDDLYAEYRALADHFGRGGSEVMKKLRALRGG